MQNSILERRVSKHTNSTLCILQWLQSRQTLLMLYLHPRWLMKCHCSVEDSRNTTNNLLKALPGEILMSRFTHSPHFCCKKHTKTNNPYLIISRRWKLVIFCLPCTFQLCAFVYKIFWAQRDVIHNLIQ